MTPDFLVAGHIVQDLLPGPDGGWRLGGAASYASLLAHKFGLRTAVLTSCSDDLPLADLLPGIETCVVPGEHTTQFRNVYEAGGQRRQSIPQRAAPLTAADLPAEWRDARIVLLGPVIAEVDASLAAAFSPETLVGAGAQGWLRETTADGAVRPIPYGRWDARPLLEHTRALFLSDEDLPFDDAPVALAEWGALVEVLAFTRGYGGADVCHRGEWRRIDPFPANPTDLTGAGDTFAAAFLIRYAETGDPWDAARYAAAAASLVIEGAGVEGVPTREMVEGRLALGSQAT
ncbi:MAG: PfkB family carbohydrate kinase [Dehalococcoidia bacterium]